MGNVCRRITERKSYTNFVTRDWWIRTDKRWCFPPHVTLSFRQHLSPLNGFIPISVPLPHPDRNLSFSHQYVPTTSLSVCWSFFPAMALCIPLPALCFPLRCGLCLTHEPNHFLPKPILLPPLVHRYVCGWVGGNFGCLFTPVAQVRRDEASISQSSRMVL